MRIIFILWGCLGTGMVEAQVQLHRTPNDTTRALEEVTVNAFYSRMRWQGVPSAVAIVTPKEMTRYGNASLVPVLNVLPGVRMEERSPASYRLSIRGSLLRSPFGVRNIKIYWNDLPLTDGGGNTYLNLLDLSQLSSATVLKGPVASAYGAGTGGALLLGSSIPFTSHPSNTYELGMMGGSYGLFQQQSGWKFSDSTRTSVLQQTHLQSDGYRQQSAMRRNALKWEGSFRWKQQQLRWLAFYSDLFYQTPGGITLAQMQQNPKLSRQPAGPFPGAIQQQAAIYNRSFFGGVQHAIHINTDWQLQGFITTTLTRFRNPFITNYEERAEHNMGTGVQLVYQKQQGTHAFKWTNGGEWLYQKSNIGHFGNRGGSKDTVQFRDRIAAAQWFVFSQLEYKPASKWTLTAGFSINHNWFRFQRISDPASVTANRQIKAVWTPRMSALYAINEQVSLYAVAAKGFSPPTVAELRPSDGNYYGDLQAELGWNYEMGIKGYLFDQQLQFDLAAYHFRLKNAIVRRNSLSGAEYFSNAGSTKQNGAEVLLKYKLLSTLSCWTSFSFQPYRFEEYRQGVNNFSGNQLTGVPKKVWVSGLDLELPNGWYASLSLNSVSKLPLTDANDVYADAYRLLQGKAGHRFQLKEKTIHLFAGIDNGLNERYTLGNDNNAAGKRYYNPAAARNFFAGLYLQFR